MPKSKFLSRLAVLLAIALCLAVIATPGYTQSAPGPGWEMFGAPGNGVNQFAGPTGIFLDSAGKIYVVDARNSRLVRVNDMTGTSWMTFGTRGGGVNQFTFPYGIFVTPAGEIFVTDIYRLVRINGMTGTDWTMFGTRGDGVGQFKGLTGISVNSAGPQQRSSGYHGYGSGVRPDLGRDRSVGSPYPGSLTPAPKYPAARPAESFPLWRSPSPRLVGP